MYHGKRIGALLLMGGEGLRFGSELPKQFHLLNNKKIYSYALDTLTQCNFFDEIILVCHKDWLEIPQGRVIAGGKTRQESAYLGLKAFQKTPEIVLIHDAARPFVSEKIIKENIEQALLWGAVNTCIPSTDTLVYAPSGEKIELIPNRAEYLRGQTPQTFRMDWILAAHEKALVDGIQNATDDCSLILRTNKKIFIVKGEEKNIKITSPLDLLIANQIINSIYINA